MKPEIINFYKDKKIPVSLMIDKRKSYLRPEQVEEAAMITYREIHAGMSIPDNEIPRYIFSKARNLKGDKYKKERLQILNYDKKVRLLAKAYKETKAELDRMQSTPEQKELKQMKIFFISVWGITFVYSILKIAGILL